MEFRCRNDVDLESRGPRIDNQCGLSQSDTIRASDIRRGRLYMTLWCKVLLLDDLDRQRPPFAQNYLQRNNLANYVRESTGWIQKTRQVDLQMGKTRVQIDQLDRLFLWLLFVMNPNHEMIFTH
jgi:hypothetical protein